MNFIKHILVVLILSTASFIQAAENKSVEELKEQMKSMQVQLDTLVDQGGKYVYLQLAQKNAISPFAVGVDAKGAMIMLEVPKSEKEASLKDKLLVLRQTLQDSAKKNVFEAAAMFVQAQVPHNGINVDGVAIEMEHKDGISVLRFMPYDIDRANKKISFRDPVDQEKPVVFFQKKVKK